MINITRKIEPTAKILGITGSSECRREVAKKLSQDFTTMVMDTFEKKQTSSEAAIITIDEVKGILKKLAPKVDFEVENVKMEDYSGCVRSILTGDKKAVKSYVLELPFQEKNGQLAIEIDDYKNLDTVSHETKHFFNFITEPKYQVRYNTLTMPQNKRTNAWHFYENNLYGDEVKSIKKLDEVDMIKAHTIEDKKARTSSIKKSTKDFFEVFGFTPEERINQLQKWRLHLKTEVEAFKEGLGPNSIGNKSLLNKLALKLINGEDLAFEFTDSLGQKIAADTKKYQTLPEKIKEIKTVLHKDAQASYTTKVEHIFCMPGKIKMVEELLAEEIAAVRAEHKALYAKN